MRIRLKGLAFFACASWLSAQTATTPAAAIVLNQAGQLIAVTGVLQSLLPGVPFGSYGHVVSAGFGIAGGAVKNDSQLLTVNAAGQVLSASPAPIGPALFGLAPDGNIGWVYFAKNAQIQNLDGSVAFSTSLLGDEVVALGIANGEGLTLLARTGTQLWAETVAVNTGVILSQTPVTGSAPALYFEGGWLVSGEAGLLWGTQSFATVAPVATLQTAGPHSVSINGAWLLNGAWKILEIPAIHRSYSPREPTLPVGALH